MILLTHFTLIMIAVKKFISGENILAVQDTGWSDLWGYNKESASYTIKHWNFRIKGVKYEE